MAKIRTSFSLSAEALALLKTISKENKRSNASMIEILIYNEAKKLKVKLP